MKLIIKNLCFLLLLISCRNSNNEVSSINPVNWEQRKLVAPVNDSLVQGSSYLSVYSQIYSQTEHKTHDLTATVSLRNPNRTDSVYIHKAAYFDTHGKLIRTYFDQTIFIAPMETVEIVIDEADQEGGTGANFIFDWSVPSQSVAPIFEGVMISTSGQQGLSFTTQGQRIE